MSAQADRKLVEMIRSRGLKFGPTIVQEAKRTGLPLALALALVEQESGFRNIFGCDEGSRSSVPFCHQKVTRNRVQELIRHVERGGASNGVGLTQLTSISFIKGAEALGGAHKVKYQCRFGFDLLKARIARYGERVGIGTYNGGEGNPQLGYADAVLARRAEWEKRINAVLKGSGQASGTLRKGDSGPLVLALQRDLLKVGEKLPKHGADSEYGNETVAAVKAFQKRAGFTGRDVDGVFGPKTRAALDKAIKALK